MAAPARIGAHVGRAAKARDAACRDGRAVALKIDLQRRADEHVAGVKPGGLAEGRLERSEPSGPVKKISERAAM